MKLPLSLLMVIGGMVGCHYNSFAQTADFRSIDVSRVDGSHVYLNIQPAMDIKYTDDNRLTITLGERSFSFPQEDVSYLSFSTLEGMQDVSVNAIINDNRSEHFIIGAEEAQILSSDGTPIEAQVFTLSGQIILHATGNPVCIKTSQLSPGAYIIRTKSSSFKFTI